MHTIIFLTIQTTDMEEEENQELTAWKTDTMQNSR